MKLLSYIKALLSRLFRDEREVIDVKSAFITFLYVQGAYEDFIVTFNIFNLGKLTLSDYLEITEPTDYFIGAFGWVDTKWSKWSSLNTIWKLYLNEERL